jgi:hypothetical protein
MILMVTYDLHNPGRDYEAIAEELKTATSWKHPQGSVWLLDTELEPSEWRDKLRAIGDDNDEYFIVRLRQNWAARKMDSDATSWLKSSSRSW